MRRQSILVILVLLLSLLICIGCGSSDQALPESAAASEEAAADKEGAAGGEAAAPSAAAFIDDAAVENVVGIFEGLEDNHTAIFSFDGAETAYYFDDPAVQEVLWGATIGSPYTLSYRYEESQYYHGYIIYEISE